MQEVFGDLPEVTFREVKYGIQYPFTISVSASFTGAMSGHHFACLILSNFCSIDLIPGHRSLNSCFQKKRNRHASY